MYLLPRLKSLGPLELGGLLGPKGPIGMGVAMGFEGRAMKSIGDLPGGRFGGNWPLSGSFSLGRDLFARFTVIASTHIGREQLLSRKKTLKRYFEGKVSGKIS